MHPVNVKKGRFSLYNRQWFRRLEGMRSRWSVLVDGTEVERGRLKMPRLDPQSGTEVHIPLTLPDLKPGQIAHLNVGFYTTLDLPWADKNAEIAWEQFELCARKPPVRKARSDGVIPDLSGNTWRVHWQGECNGSLEWNRKDGRLKHLEISGEQVLASGPELLVWRAPTDNDGMIQPILGGISGVLSRWLEWGLDRIQSECTRTGHISRNKMHGFTSEHVLETTSGTIRHRQTLWIPAPGELVFKEYVRIPRSINDLPRIGAVMDLVPGFENLEYFGRGSHENYRDRNRGARLGRYSSAVDNQYVPYILPQEHGNRTDVRWCALDNSRVGLLFMGPAGGEFSAGHYREEDLYPARHTSDLKAIPETRVHIDLANRGVGTGACGPDTLPKYRINSGVYSFTWHIKCYTPGQHDIAELARYLYKTPD
jgi:beta-galactosidase